MELQKLILMLQYFMRLKHLLFLWLWLLRLLRALRIFQALRILLLRLLLHLVCETPFLFILKFWAMFLSLFMLFVFVIVPYFFLFFASIFCVLCRCVHRGGSCEHHHQCLIWVGFIRNPCCCWGGGSVSQRLWFRSGSFVLSSDVRNAVAVYWWHWTYHATRGCASSASPGGPT